MKIAEYVFQIAASLVSYFATKGIDSIIGKYLAMARVAFEKNATAAARAVYNETMRNFVLKSKNRYSEWQEWRKKALTLPDWAFSNPHLDLIRQTAARHTLPWDLVLAVVQTESAGNSMLTRYEKDYPYLNEKSYPGMTDLSFTIQQKTSWGLMQVMGSTAIDRGILKDYGPPSAMVSPVVGLEIGCRHLKLLYEKYKDPIKTYAAYNGGTPERARKDAVSRFKVFYAQIFA